MILFMFLYTLKSKSTVQNLSIKQLRKMIFGWRTESGSSEKRESRKKETAASDAD